MTTTTHAREATGKPDGLEPGLGDRIQARPDNWAVSVITTGAGNQHTWELQDNPAKCRDFPQFGQVIGCEEVKLSVVVRR